MKNFTIGLCLSAIILNACTNNKKTQSTEAIQQDTIAKISEVKNGTGDTAAFDINSIPITTHDIGIFPFFSAPEKNKYRNAENKDFDREYFAVKNKLIPIEGKSYKAELVPQEDQNTNTFSPLLVEKNYEQVITALGGVKVNSGKISKEERERIGEDELQNKNYGYVVGFGNEDISTYLIRKKDAEIWIQLQLNSAYGHIAIVEKGNLTPSISLIKAEDLKKEIDTKGKAILHINFDTDQSTLKPEGIQAVDEIVKLLQQNTTLKLSIQGHTDNAGNTANNLKLSQSRAETVKTQLEKAGIAKDRLKAKGFGSTAPIADNGTDNGKAENRRVELVKF